MSAVSAATCQIARCCLRSCRRGCRAVFGLPMHEQPPARAGVVEVGQIQHAVEQVVAHRLLEAAYLRLGQLCRVFVLEPPVEQHGPGDACDRWWRQKVRSIR